MPNHDLVVGVEVAQVVRGDDAEPVHEPARHVEVVRDGVAVLGQQLRQHVLAVRAAQAHAQLPGEVVEPDVVQVDLGGVHIQQPGELALEADRHVAQADRLVPGLEQGPGDDADRIGEVDDPGVRVGAAHPLGDVQHDGHGPQRLGEAAGAGGLLADAAALQRPGLVLVPRGLSADAQLEEDGVGAGHARVQVGGGGDLPGVVLLGEDPPGQAADQFEPVGRRVDEHQLLDRQRVPQPGEAVDQFRGVGGPATNYCELHCQPFTPVSVTPSTNAF